MRIFLSYANEQRQPAEAIAFTLRSRGHTVFLDKDDLPPGLSYDVQIQAAVASVDLFIFLISPNSVDKGRYTLTELEFARARWRVPDRFVLPVMVVPTAMSEVPTYLKAVSILEPSGNVAAEVAFQVDQLRGRTRSTRIVGVLGVMGFVSGLFYWGSSDGWLPAFGVPYRRFIGLGDLILSPMVGPFAMPTGILLGVAMVRMRYVALWGGVLLWFAISFAAFVGEGVGIKTYHLESVDLKQIESFIVEQRSADEGAAADDTAAEDAVPESTGALVAIIGRQNADASDNYTPSEKMKLLGKAYDQEWQRIRFLIGAAYGIVVALGFALAGLITNRSTMTDIRVWFGFVLVGGATASAIFGFTNSYSISFVVYYTAMFLTFGYVLTRAHG